MSPCSMLHISVKCSEQCCIVNGWYRQQLWVATACVHRIYVHSLHVLAGVLWDAHDLHGITPASLLALPWVGFNLETAYTGLLKPECDSCYLLSCVFLQVGLEGTANSASPQADHTCGLSNPRQSH